MPPQNFEPSGFLMQLSKDKKYTRVMKSFSALYHQLLNSNRSLAGAEADTGAFLQHCAL